VLRQLGIPLGLDEGDRCGRDDHDTPTCATDCPASPPTCLPIACVGYLADRTPDRPPITIELRTGERPMHLETVDGSARVRHGSAEQPDAVLTGTPRLVLGVLTGMLDLVDARALGLRCVGDEQALRRVQPQTGAAQM
jgi:hypothetical protein